MAPQKRSILPRLLISTLVVGLSVGVIFRQQEILDWWTLRNYDAPVEVQSIATDTTMNNFAKKLFYVHKPQLQNKQTFYISCEEGETTVVLGCYKARNGIYILDVNDERLNGIEQVTAAHELLHAAYDRLSVAKRADINAKLQAFYKNLNNPQIVEKIELYKKNGADISNELHSILGTEVTDLSPELEQYYRTYFTNRSKITAYADQYQEVFTSRKKKLLAYDAQLQEIDTQIKFNTQKVEALQTEIKKESNEINQLLQSGSIAEYNKRVPTYNNSLVPYRNLISQTNNLISQYKTILEERNNVAIEAQELSKALDSRIQPVENNL